MWEDPANGDGRRHSLLVGQPDLFAANAEYLTSPKISASVVALEPKSPTTGEWYSDSVFLFNLSLSGRPASAQGRFEAMDEFRSVGDLFFVPARQRYLAKGGPGRQRTFFVEMRADDRLAEDAELALDGLPVLRACMNLPFDRSRDLLVRMANEVHEPGFASELLIEGLGVTLLAETLRMLRRVEADAAPKGGLSPWRLRMIEARVHDDDKIPTLAELADLCGLSRRQLMRAFRAETGRTVGDFVQDVMLARAKQLLKETNLSITEIATQVGFRSVTSFSTAFRREIGQSPRVFRTSPRH